MTKRTLRIFILFIVCFLSFENTFSQKKDVLVECGYLLFTSYDRLIFFPNKRASQNVKVKDLEKSWGKIIWGADYDYIISPDSGKQFIVDYIYARNDTIISHIKNCTFRIVPVKMTYKESVFILSKNECSQVLYKNNKYNVCERGDLDIIIIKTELIK